jgi:hypothetical protein
MPSTSTSHQLHSLDAFRKAAQIQTNSRQLTPAHATKGSTALRRYESEEEELSEVETGGSERLLSPTDATGAEMKPRDADKHLENPFLGTSPECDEYTESQTLPAQDLLHQNKGVRPLSVDTIKKNGSPSASSRAWEKVEAVTTPSTPGAASPLQPSAVLLETVLVPPEATESEAMSYHQSFFNDQASSDDELDPESPILIATSVNLLVPATKPNLISIKPSPFNSRSYGLDTTKKASVLTWQSTKNTRIDDVNSHPSLKMEKKQRREASSFSSAHSNYSTRNLSISSTSSDYSTTPSGSVSLTPGEARLEPDTSFTSLDRKRLDRSATIRGARSKRNRHTFVHNRSPGESEEKRSTDASQEQMTISYPDVGTWSRNVNADEKHIYSTVTSQSEIPPVPPLTPTSIPIPSTPSRTGTPTEAVLVSPTFNRRDFYHARTTSERSTGTENSIQSLPSVPDASPDIVREKSLRRHKRIYTTNRPQSLRSLRMENCSYNSDMAYPSPSTNKRGAAHQIPNSPSRKSLSFPYQHLSHPNPGFASSPYSPSSRANRPSSIRSMNINHTQSIADLPPTPSTSNLSMYSFSYADSDDSGDNNGELARGHHSSSKRVARKKSMKSLREAGETVGRAMGKNFMTFGLGSWKKKNSSESNDSISNSNMATPINPYGESMVR